MSCLPSARAETGLSIGVPTLVCHVVSVPDTTTGLTFGPVDTV